jgi:hypothetical protein
MPGRDEIREAILGAAEGARGSVEALAALGLSAQIEDFDVEVNLGTGSGDEPTASAVVRFSVIVDHAADRHRSVA